MYDPIFAKSFSGYERKKFGFYALILSFIIALSICSIFNPHLHPLSVIGDALEFQLSINDVQNVLVNDDTVENSEPNVKKILEPICTTLEGGADYCEIEGDIRIQPNSSTIFVATNDHGNISISTNSWNIKPYPRKGLSVVKQWTVKLVRYNNTDFPKCTQNHSNPAILFSVGGYSGNLFHGFADVLFPLYTTSFHFKREVHFLASDYKPWWITKYRDILNKLTKHEILDIANEKLQVHCYNKIVAGLKFEKELIMEQSSLMHNFRQLLRQTYSLERKGTVRTRKGDGTRPRLMIISRNKTRILTNEDEVSKVARKLGFEVVLAEANLSSNMSSFAQMVNSCDVLMGIHGAGLTNMLFLPDNAILIQLVPFGGIDVFAKLDFGNPASGMNIRYLEYKITTNESSLSRQYSIDNPILKDPISFHKKGWDTIRSIYLENQNITVDIARFKGTLVEALKLLRH